MTSLRELEAPLRAWRTFRDVARATRTLAAAQALRWADQLERTEAHAQRCVALARCYVAPPPADAPRMVVALGTDLGLCGPLNRFVAEATAPLVAEGSVSMLVVVGARLAAALEDTHPNVELSAPTSFGAIESLAGRLDGLLLRAGPAVSTRLVIVQAYAVDPDGTPETRVLDAPPVPPLDAGPRPVVELSPVNESAPVAAALLRHARLTAALVRAAACECETRWRAMNRAFDAAERRIDEQERRIQSVRQELITQQMLEARQGRPR